MKRGHVERGNPTTKQSHDYQAKLLDIIQKLEFIDPVKYSKDRNFIETNMLFFVVANI